MKYLIRDNIGTIYGYYETKGIAQANLELYSEEEMEYKDVRYTPNLQRPITIIDPETTEEVKPILYFDKETNEVRGKCKLKPYKSYFAFEIKDKKEN